MNVVIISIISLLAICIPRTLLSMFIHDPVALDIEVNYLRIVSGGYVLFSIYYVSNGIMNGAGHTIIIMVMSLVSLWIVRVPLSAILIQTKLGLNGIWISINLSFAVNIIISLVIYFSGKWKKPIVDKINASTNSNETGQKNSSILFEEI